MFDVIKGNTALINTLTSLSTKDGVTLGADNYGNAQHWFELSSPSHLTAAAAALKDMSARLSLISGYSRASQPDAEEAPFAACYNFVLDSVIYNITAIITKKEPQVPTITPWFANAGWHEREMMELVGITVAHQPNPNRLFLDASLDQGMLSRLVPLSVMMNGACTKDLWERILSSKEGSH